MRVIARVHLATTLMVAVCVASVAASAASLEEEFRSPPADARPACYWYWMNGHITKAGISADLEGMRQAGLGGAIIMNVGRAFPRGPVRMYTPEWYELMKHAIREGGRNKIAIYLATSPGGGWSGCGGPWITPDLAMKKLTWSETRVQGGCRVRLSLARPPVLKSYRPEFFEPPKPLDWYRDVAVLAFPTPAVEMGPDGPLRVTSGDGRFCEVAVTDDDDLTFAQVSVAPDQPGWIQFESGSPYPARSLYVKFHMGQFAPPRATLWRSDDGASWEKVRVFAVPKRAVLAFPFEAAPARFWRTTFESGGPMTARVIEARLLRGYRIEQWSAKAMFDEVGLDEPRLPPASVQVAEDCVVRKDTIVDLTQLLQPDGSLEWDAPPGEWTILRFGYTPTGRCTGTTPAHGGAGLECDKFDPEALEVHWRHAFAPFYEDASIRTLIRGVHHDSWELGAQNWSERFPEQFRTKAGYDIRPWLPTMTGRVVDSLEASERFLWDLRRVICDLIAECYFRRLRDLCHRVGWEFTCEPYHEEQFDTDVVGGIADVPVCEAWVGPVIPHPFWMKLAASPAHVYGKRRVGCEAFTSNKIPGDGDWPLVPWDLKPLGDAILCGGVNWFILHVSAHQPWMGVVPGMTVEYCGQQFHRGNTWWSLAHGWTRYLSRCSHLLRQGTFVADVLYFAGDSPPAKSLWPQRPWDVPFGYDYDVCDRHVLQRLQVEGGRLKVEGGGTYRVLVLPDHDVISPAIAQKIWSLVEGGTVVVGPTPGRAPGLQMSDEAVRNALGGKRIRAEPLAVVLRQLGVAPDFTAEPSAPFRFIHRALDDGRQVYFVANLSNEAVSVQCGFRVVGLQPELWDPLTGEIRRLSEFEVQDERTVIPLQFAPRQSWFVVFSTERPEVPHLGRNFPQYRPALDLSGPWEVRFDARLGGPQEAVQFERLSDWSRHSDPRVRFYSGPAVYRVKFVMPEVRDARGWLLDLGEVRHVAAVRLNGQDLGVVWCAPWQVGISHVVHSGTNELEITVVNTWQNRMIGDEQLPLDYERSPDGMVRTLPPWLTNAAARPSGRLTFATLSPFKKDDLLVPSGLLGPVRILRVGMEGSGESSERLEAAQAVERGSTLRSE